MCLLKHLSLEANSIHNCYYDKTFKKSCFLSKKVSKCEMRAYLISRFFNLPMKDREIQGWIPTCEGMIEGHFLHQILR